MKRPNILYVHSHDTGRTIQPYGHAVPTPDLQRFAEQGVLFRQAYCGAPTCSPSRAVLLTGQAAHSCGQFGLVNRGFELRDRHKHLAHTLREAGYHTALAGVHHVVRDPSTCGYVQHLRPVSNRADGAAAAAAEFFAHPGPEPFFLAVGFVPTHRRFPVPGPQDDSRYCLAPAPLPDTPEVRHDMAAYKASARVLDGCIGTVLDALDASGRAENTLVIVTTDHGIAFPGMKCSLTDHGMGVMLLVRGPGGFMGGKVCDALVSHIDVFPTVCDLAGIDHPEWLEGQSLLPLVSGQSEAIHDEIFAEVNYHCPYEPMRCVRTRRWKYIRRFHRRAAPFLSNCDGGPSKDLLLRHGWAEQRRPAEELFDLIFDPNEAHNLAAEPEHADTLRDLRGRLDRWMRRTDDPLLAGPIPLPPGAFASEPDDVGPRDIWNRVPRPKGFG